MAYTRLVRRIPLRELVRIHRALRRSFFSIDWPKGAPGVYSDVSPAQVEGRLRRDHHFESGVTLSYRYEGERLNVRRPEGVMTLQGKTVQLQLHIRGRKVDDMVWEYAGHIEPDPDEHPRLHIEEVGFRWDRDLTQQVLSEAGVHTWENREEQ